jgi:hypothetical protein
MRPRGFGCRCLYLCEAVNRHIPDRWGIVQKIMQLISSDADGKRILDYLGLVLKELMKPSDVKIMVLDVRRTYSAMTGRGQAVLYTSKTKMKYGASDPRVVRIVLNSVRQ